uniref:hypothetical protein n=1 Tax=Rheinheimera sp. TaxID=1869214 RepID=UPI00307D3BC6
IEYGALAVQFSQTYSKDAWVYIPISFLFLISVFLGGYSFEKRRSKGIMDFAKKVNMQSESESRVLTRYFFSALILLILSIVGYSLYVSVYGGYFAYLAYSGALRSGAMHELPANPYSFLIAFGSFSFIASYLFFSIFPKKYKLISFVFFVVAMIFSVYVLFSWLGRIVFLFYFMVFFMTFVIRDTDLQPRFFRMSCLFVLFLLLLISVNNILDRKDYSGIMQMLSMELVFPVSSLMNALNKADSFRLGLDFFSLPIYWMPQRLWSDYMVSVEAVNTELLFGIAKGLAGNSSSVPADILTLSYLNLGYFGFIFFGFFTGYVLSAVDAIVSQIRVLSVRRIFYCYMLLNLSVLLPIYGDPSHISGRIFPIVGFIIVMYFSKFFTIDLRGLKRVHYVRD